MLANLSMTPVSAVPLADVARVQALLPTTALSSPTDVSLPRGVYWEVLWAVVLTCLKLSPGTPESTLISGQCTLVCCCSSALPCRTEEETMYSGVGGGQCVDSPNSPSLRSSLKGPAAAPTPSLGFESCPGLTGKTQQ